MPEEPRRTGRNTALIVLLAATSAPAIVHAQSATPGSVITLDPIVIEGETLSAADVAEERFAVTPGGATLLRTDDLPQQANVRLSDALRRAPGIVIQDFFGGFDQPRLQIRGSGLQQNPVERGVLFLQDGLPLNRADGSYIVGFANPSQAEFIEINRGYTTNRLGATVLGGALNFVSPTGSSAPGLSFEGTGGSFGHVEGTAQAGFSTETMDGHLSFDAGRRDGFRDINDSSRIAANANGAIQISDAVSARLFTGYSLIDFDVAGPLPRDVLENSPESVFGGPTVIPGTPPTVFSPGPNVLRDRPNREADQVRIGGRVTGDFDDHVVDAALGFSITDDTFTFPISGGVRETDGSDFTVVGRYAYQPDQDSVLPLFEATILYTQGSADRTYRINEAGRAGAVIGENDLSAETLSIYAGANIPLGAGFVLSPGVAYARATRDNDDRFGSPTRPTIAFNPVMPDQRLPNGAVPATDTSYDRSYDGFSPSLALSWQPVEDHTVFAAVSRSFEPPTHDDLLTTINGTPNSSAGRPSPGAPGLAADAFATPDLDAQRATTVEAGWRGRFDRGAVDVVVYHSWIDNELLSLRDVTGAPLGAVNADETRHFGIEFGATAAITEELTGRLGYTFQDFRFRDDPLRGDNRLAGAPPHVVTLDLDYAITDDLSVGGSLLWRPDTTPVDNFNTLSNDSFAVLDLRASYAVTPWAGVFVDIRNVTDTTYASSTLIVDQARADQAAFLPGDGRAFYGGFQARF